MHDFAGRQLAAPAPEAARPVSAGSSARLLALQARAGNRATVALLRSPDPETLEVDEVDEPEDDDAEVPDHEGDDVSVDDVLEEITEATRTSAYAVEGEEDKHTAEVRFVDGEPVPGVNSDFVTMEAIGRALLAGGVLQSVVDRLLRGVRRLALVVRRRRAEAGLSDRPAARRTRALGLATRLRSQGPTRSERAYERVRTAMAALALECGRVHRLAWRDHRDVLGLHLMPSGAMFEARAFTGDQHALTRYAAGTSTDPIPIVWYKAPTDYPRVRVPTSSGWTTVERFQALTVGDRTFGVADANQPDGAIRLRKVSHEGDRTDQVALNRVLSSAGAEVETATDVWRRFADARVDGDHVRDLGFGGRDVIGNYWPLDRTINQRGMGYNSGYVVNYLTSTGVGTSRAIGGMIGKWFRIKGYLRGTDPAVPAESGTEDAGTTTLAHGETAV